MISNTTGALSSQVLFTEELQDMVGIALEKFQTLVDIMPDEEYGFSGSIMQSLITDSERELNKIFDAISDQGIRIRCSYQKNRRSRCHGRLIAVTVEGGADHV